MTTWIQPRQRSIGTSTVRRILPFVTHRMVGPFIFADLIGPEELAAGEGIDVPEHPHIGLATVTYLFDGAMVHRDSTGAVQQIEPGAVNWMHAGRGVTHTERSPADDRAADSMLTGLQTWVALPTEHEDDEPWFEHCAADHVPQDRIGDTTVRLAVGTGFGMASPVRVASPLVLADVSLAGGGFSVPADHPERGVLALTPGLTLDGTSMAEGSMAVLDAGDQPRVEGSGRCVVLGGDPVGPRQIWWNFVASSAERIEAAKDAWRDQRFPEVPDDHDGWVRLPE